MEPDVNQTAPIMFPRRPLRIRQSQLYRAPDGSTMLLARDVVVRPDDPDYDTEYAMAVHDFHNNGQPMPYVSGVSN